MIYPFTVRWKRELTYQTITAEGIANWKNSFIVRKTSVEKERRVFSQVDEYFTYRISISAFSQYEKQIESAAPAFPRFNLNMKVHERGTWMHREAIELKTIGNIKL